MESESTAFIVTYSAVAYKSTSLSQVREATGCSCLVRFSPVRGSTTICLQRAPAVGDPEVLSTSSSEGWEDRIETELLLKSSPVKQ